CDTPGDVEVFGRTCYRWPTKWWCRSLNWSVIIQRSAMTTVLPQATTTVLRTAVPTAAGTRGLIANRGGIALRIIRAAHDLGIKAVAVYTRADSDADFVDLADDAWLLDGSGAGETYLDVDKILALAKRSGADAIHPGYGYLAENAIFAQSVIDAGLT